MRAVPLIRSLTERFGTFELWHRSSRDLPTVGKYTESFGVNGTLTRFDILALPTDTRPDPIRKEGISLLECFQLTPQLETILHENDCLSKFTRGKIEQTEYKDGREVGTRRFSAVFHPNNPDVLSNVLKNFKIPSRLFERFDFKEIDNSFIVNLSLNDGDEIHFEMPSSFQQYSDDVYFTDGDIDLNEFGKYYVGMFILGSGPVKLLA
jgi:hypothetical protein